MLSEEQQRLYRARCKYSRKGASVYDADTGKLIKTYPSINTAKAFIRAECAVGNNSWTKK